MKLRVLFISACLLLGMATNAHAEPGSITAFFAWVGSAFVTTGAVGTAAYATAALVGFMVVMTVASTAYSIYKQAQMKKSLGGLDARFEGGLLVNTRGSREVVEVVYGQIRKGGNQVLVDVGGDINDWIYIAQTISEGEIEVDGNEIVYLNDMATTDPFFSGHTTIYFFDGGADQVSSNHWPLDYMRHTAWLFIGIKYSRDKFQGLPLITYLIKGKKLYDPRTGLTVWSDNPALVVYDIMTNKRYGLGLNPLIIDTDSISDAANFCDAPYAGDSFKFQFNGVLNAQDAAGDVIEKILLNFRGYLMFSDGVYKLKYFNYSSPVMTIDENDIVEDSFEIDIPGIPETPNKVRVSFIDPEQNYTVSDFTYEDQSAVTLDGMERDFEFNLIGTTSYDQATRLAVYGLERERLNKIFHLSMGHKGLCLEPGDTIAVTHELPRWTEDSAGRICRITHITYNPDYTVSMSLIEEDELLYDTVLNVGTHAYNSSSFPNPTDAPPSIILNPGDITEEIATNKDMTYSRIKVDFTRPSSAWWDYADVYLKIVPQGGDPESYPFKYYTSADDEFYIDPAEDGKTYYLKFISVSILKVREDEVSAPVHTYTVIGKNFVPVWPDGATFTAMVAGDTVNFRWDKVTDIDTAGYEIRRGDEWYSGVFVAFVPKGITTAFPAVGIKPGDHTFMIKAKDTVGNYTAEYKSASVTVYDPPGYQTPQSWLETGAVDIVIDNCDSAWTKSQAPVTVSTDTSEAGIVSQKFNIWTSFTTGNIAYRNSNHNLSAMTHVTIRVKSDIALNAGDLQLLLCEGTGGATPRETLNLPALNAGVWTAATLTLINPSLDDDIRSTVIKATQDKGTFNLWIDDIKASYGIHSGTDWYNDPQEGMVLRVPADSGTGYWESPVRNLGALLKTRLWSDYELLQFSQETTWSGKYGVDDTWEKYPEEYTWNAIFTQTAVLNFRIELYHSTDGIIWSGPITFFHIYCCELETQYLKYRIYLEDISADTYQYVKSGTLALVRAFKS